MTEPDRSTAPTAVTFHFYPSCPWTWITSRWVVEVAPRRALAVTWQPFSLRYRNRDNPGDDRHGDELNRQHPAMRILAATAASSDNDAVGRLYTALGSLIHHDGDANLEQLGSAIASAGLDPSVLDAAADESWDPVIAQNTDRARQLVGDEVGIPIMVIENRPTTFFGPVLSPAPTGDDALALWDAFAQLGRFDGLSEIKRTREVSPIFGPRPTMAEGS